MWNSSGSYKGQGGSEEWAKDLVKLLLSLILSKGEEKRAGRIFDLALSGIPFTSCYITGSKEKEPEKKIEEEEEETKQQIKRRRKRQDGFDSNGTRKGGRWGEGE